MGLEKGTSQGYLKCMLGLFTESMCACRSIITLGTGLTQTPSIL